LAARSGKGYQQTHILTGIASGGLLGLGIGNGNIRRFFDNYLIYTDDVFGVICEEWGYIFALVLVLSFVAIAVSALVNSIAARSTFYSISAVAGAGMLLFQCALNIFGITDVLPLTGVTLPFVSQGGTSLMGLFWHISRQVMCALTAIWEVLRRNENDYKKRHFPLDTCFCFCFWLRLYDLQPFK
jgi:cell division protein FtsW (lipid II flippase)